MLIFFVKTVSYGIGHVIGILRRISGKKEFTLFSGFIIGLKVVLGLVVEFKAGVYAGFRTLNLHSFQASGLGQPLTPGKEKQE